MRTDLKLPALLVAGLLASAGARLVAQDTVSTPAEPAAATVRTADRIVLNGDAVIRPNEVVEGRVVVMRGDLRVEGRVTGGVTVGAGDLVVAPGAVIGGAATVSAGSLSNAGSIGGDAQVTGGRLVNSGRIAGEMRVESARAGRAALGGRSSAEQAARIRGGWLGSFGDGIEGLFSTLSLGLLLAGLGAGAVFYGYPRLQTTSDALRADPLRAGLGGVAAAVLVVPAFLVLVFALTITIIGIPLLLVAVPLYAVAVSAALGFGLVAAAHAIGERTAEQRGTLLGGRNGYTYVLTGLALLLAPVVLANVLRMTGVLGWLGGLLEFLGWLVIWGSAVFGTGAVLLTRAGMRAPTPARPYDPIFDSDPAFGAGGGHA